MPPEEYGDWPQPVVPPGVDMVYADDCVVVLNKPAGLLSVPGKGPDKQDCLSARVQRTFSDALVVHRLDMATSGLLVMARSATVQRTLNDAFAERQIHKIYTAVVQGLVAPDDRTDPGDHWHTIDLPIGRDWSRRPLRNIDPVNGKPGITRWRCVGQDPQAHTSRLELQPVTGRSHQLRLHLQSIGHPILGDRLYAPANAASGSDRLMLHASTLGLMHPLLGETMYWHCAAPF